MLNRRQLAFAVVGMAACCVVAGIAYAAGGIPGADGTIQGCYDSGGNVKVVAALPCPKGYTALSWNQAGLKGDKGETGKDGTNGVSPTVAQLLAGNSHCPAGGAAITDAAGSTAYVCSGQDGQAFSGTFTSPNGQFSLKVTDAGVEIKGPDSTITVPSGGGVNVTSAGAVSITSGGAMSVKSGGAMSAESGSGMSVKSGGAMSVTVAARLETRADGELVHITRDRDVEVFHDETHYVAHDRITAIDHDDTYHSRHNRTETVDNDQTTSIHRNRTESIDGTTSLLSSGVLSVTGSSVKINDGTTCQPAARVGDQVNASSAISTGSGTVCIGG